MSLPLNAYIVTAIFKDGGEYVPQDPVAGGNFYRDRIERAIITVDTARRAHYLMGVAYPGAKIDRPKLLGPAHG